ncbi:KTSC domain-containing protein [Methyloligella solikamskensis]|uniref:KTSC domain-containing protein n=1 Tax=Methyloligella solikamskensis TaxID=1177756 RepID=A0ABW3JBL0_9HYPH
MPSSVIRTFFYDFDSQRLTVIFQSGRRYVYDAVPEIVYRELAAAPSTGAYFNENIRDNYQFRRFDQAG